MHVDEVDGAALAGVNATGTLRQRRASNPSQTPTSRDSNSLHLGKLQPTRQLVPEPGEALLHGRGADKGQRRPRQDGSCRRRHRQAVVLAGVEVEGRRRRTGRHRAASLPAECSAPPPASPAPSRRPRNRSPCAADVRRARRSTAPAIPSRAPPTPAPSPGRPRRRPGDLREERRAPRPRAVDGLQRGPRPSTSVEIPSTPSPRPPGAPRRGLVGVPRAALNAGDQRTFQAIGSR